MGNINGLREQVEELKQRLNGAGAQSAAEPGELKARLASIKTSLESMHSEIAQLKSDKDQLTAAREQLAADKRQLGEENEQLRKMLADVLAAIDGQSGDASANIVQEFIAETDPLIKPAGTALKSGTPSKPGTGSESVIAAGRRRTLPPAPARGSRQPRWRRPFPIRPATRPGPRTTPRTIRKRTSLPASGRGGGIPGAAADHEARPARRLTPSAFHTSLSQTANAARFGAPRWF